MIELRPPNDYWGRKSGAVLKDGSFGFKLKKWGNGTNNSHTRDRKAKAYSNKKLERRRGWVRVETKKGSKKTLTSS